MPHPEARSEGGLSQPISSSLFNSSQPGWVRPTSQGARLDPPEQVWWRPYSAPTTRERSLL